MTRENKLALIIGFGLVLVVGILVSDHFSKAYTQNAAQLANANSQVDALANRIDSQLLLHPVQDPPAPPPNRRDADRRNQATPPADNGASRDVIPANQRRNEPESIVLGLGNQEPSGASGSSGGSGRQDAPTNPRTGSTSGANDAFTWHTVKPGETLSKIALDYYGDRNAWRRIVEANPDRIRNADNVPQGVEIRIPRPAGQPNAAPNATTPRQPTPPASTPPPARTHTVARGESLSTIAARYLGSAGKWRDLYDYNKSVISDPDNVREGTTLRIPPR